MNLLEKLKTLFEGKVGGDFFSNNTFKLFDFSKNTNSPLESEETPKGTKLKIDLSKTDEDEKKALKEILDKKVQDEDETFLTKKSSEKTEQIKRNLLGSKDNEVLFFYKDKVSSDIYLALEMSLIVKSAFEKGEDISELKRDIAWKFPRIGNNICNLTTSNYFHEYFKELYDTMNQDPNFELKEYTKEVERIVTELPYMVFINRHKSLEEFRGQVEFKIDRLKRYGARKLKLHALGRDNVEKAEKIAFTQKDVGGLSINSETNRSKTITTIVFNF